jgi:hypothetical protein
MNIQLGRVTVEVKWAIHSFYYCLDCSGFLEGIVRICWFNSVFSYIEDGLP